MGVIQFTVTNSLHMTVSHKNEFGRAIEINFELKHFLESSYQDMVD